MNTTTNDAGDEEIRVPEEPRSEETIGGISNEYVLNFAFISFVLLTCLQFVCALAAHSQSMLADCAAMTVDCASYLINCLAERFKHKPDSTEDGLTASERQYRKQMRVLQLELAPPFISVCILIAVTVKSIDEALTTLLERDPGDEEETQPSLFLMLLLSTINFFLDGLNMWCFARADQAKGLSHGFTAAVHPRDYINEMQASQRTQKRTNNPCCSNSNKFCQQPATATETTQLLPSSSDYASKVFTRVASIDETDEEEFLSNSSQSSRGLNLNMCSAWTHVCADTLRTIAVLLAAGFASLFPKLLSPADADSYGAILVSIIIIFSLAPLIEGLYFTAWEMYHVHSEHQRQVARKGEDDALVSLSV